MCSGRRPNVSSLPAPDDSARAALRNRKRQRIGDAKAQACAVLLQPAEMKFMAGEPMKPATNRVFG